MAFVMNMRFPAILRRSDLARACIGLCLLTASTVASAQNQLGPVDNLLLKNPHVVPAAGQFGRGVTTGVFDDDGTRDLTVSENGDARLRVLRGAPFEVGSGPTIPFFATTVTMPLHGYVMASGDFDGDDRDEIAVGHPRLHAD